MPNLKKYRVYVYLNAEMYTDVLAKDEEQAKKMLAPIDLSDGLKHICDREWDIPEMSDGIKKVKEVVMHSYEIEV